MPLFTKKITEDTEVDITPDALHRLAGRRSRVRIATIDGLDIHTGTAVGSHTAPDGNVWLAIDADGKEVHRVGFNFRRPHRRRVFITP